jgi:hypothetical protein
VTFDAVRHSQYGPQTNLNHETVAETRDLFPDPSGPPANRDEVLMMVADTDHGKH